MLTDARSSSGAVTRRPTAPRAEATDQVPDEDLVAAFVRGDERAYVALVDRYRRRVFGICIRYFGDPVDAEDAAQDVFLTLYRRAATFRGGSKFSTWMYRVTTNACNDLARKRARRPQKADAVVEELPLADADDHIGRRLLTLELREALLQLQPEHRDAVVAHTVEGRPYHEIAAEAGVAVGTIKSRVHRGHAKLAAILSEGEGSGAEPSDRGPPPT
ncbi:RNA polymerase sigma factor [Euzebya sp.]|uniref:RNA polymerase sigma factor n=1 Tax=Euzebya sp. TaxID=1971409 RepID=UPI003517A09F